MPPSAGGPDERDAGVETNDRFRRVWRRNKPIRAVVQPYDGFVRRTVFSAYP